MRLEQLRQHRDRQLELTNDLAFVETVEDEAGPYVDAPEHAMVLSIDEEAQIQPLDRTQPGILLERGRLGTMTHDHQPNATPTPIAALCLLHGSFKASRSTRSPSPPLSPAAFAPAKSFHRQVTQFLADASALPAKLGKLLERNVSKRERW